MAKVDKLALVRLALKHTLESLDVREKLCVLADLYNKPPDGESSRPRWWGNGKGPNGLEQGIYNSMITFRRVSNLWSTLMVITPDIKQETYIVRDLLVKSLNAQSPSIDLPQEPEEAAQNE